MDVSGALHTLRKHWILTSVLVLLTLVAAMGMVQDLRAVPVNVPGRLPGVAADIEAERQQSLPVVRRHAHHDGRHRPARGAGPVDRGRAGRPWLHGYYEHPLTTRSGFRPGSGRTRRPGPCPQGPSWPPQGGGYRRRRRAGCRSCRPTSCPRTRSTARWRPESPKATLMVSKKARPVVAVLVVASTSILAIPQVVDAVQSVKVTAARRAASPCGRHRDAGQRLSSSDRSKLQPARLRPSASGRKRMASGEPDAGNHGAGNR